MMAASTLALPSQQWQPACWLTHFNDDGSQHAGFAISQWQPACWLTHFNYDGGQRAPTVSDLDVFGCELELLSLHTQHPLPEAFRTVLLQRPQLQIVVRPCMVDGHSIWQFQEDGKESYPKLFVSGPTRKGKLLTEHFFVLHPRSGT